MFVCLEYTVWDYIYFKTHMHKHTNIYSKFHFQEDLRFQFIVNKPLFKLLCTHIFCRFQIAMQYMQDHLLSRFQTWSFRYQSKHIFNNVLIYIYLMFKVICDHLSVFQHIESVNNRFQLHAVKKDCVFTRHNVVYWVLIITN